METCKATIQEGPRKGNRCKFPPNSTMYCGRHQRNKIYDDGMAEGKKWCRLFFRGCSNEVLEDGMTSCEDCRTKLMKKENHCKHEGCTFKTNDEYCKKHVRDIYYSEEKEKGIAYCDIARGCFTILDGSKKSCDSCLEKIRETDKKRLDSRRQLIEVAQTTNNTTRCCVKCTKDFESFQTGHRKDSMHCKECLEKQAKCDKKREGRVRNYKEERLNNLEASYKTHTVESLKRGYGDFQINFDEFKELVTSACHYCKSKTDSEAVGIDRINNDIGYTKENCVPACWTCNRMKHFYHPAFFIEKCKIMAKHMIPSKAFYKKWSLYYTRTNYRNYSAYKREAEGRKLEFEITQEQWNWLSRSPCYLCGFQSAKGIGLDRVDNTIRKYSIETSRPCCGSCNSMKNEMTLPDLLQKCKVISEAYPSYEQFASVPISKNPLKPLKEVKEPRTYWKASTVYYAIMSNSTEDFYETYKSSIIEDEFTDLCKVVKSSPKDAAQKRIDTFLQTMRKRRYRKNHINTPSK